MEISVSQLKMYKACRRSWWLKYHEGLEPVAKSDALTIGTNYHDLVDRLYKGEDVDLTEPTKETAMARAYAKYIKGNVPCEVTEEWISKEIANNIEIIGRIDGRTPGGVVVEHKTTSRDLAFGGEYEYALQWDEQVFAYMYITGTREMIYTVVKKPTIRQKKTETDQDFFDRMCEWYDEDTEGKIRTFCVKHTDAEVEEWARETLATIVHMRSNEVCYKNTLHCTQFGISCPYRSICLHYDPEQQYMEYTRRETNGNYKA